MVRAGICRPERQGRVYRFSFQDLVLLRAAQGLLAERVPTRRVKRAIAELARQLPPGRPLSGVRIYADGRRVVARDGPKAWQPDSGQGVFVFDVEELARKSRVLIAPPERKRAHRREPEGLSAQEWFDKGLSLEERDLDGAADAYRRALALDPDLGDAHVNLGRILHELGEIGEALKHYWKALEHDASDPITHYNVALALDDAGDRNAALGHYHEAVSLDPSFADAHFNLGRLLERLGRREEALRHLLAYRRLTGGGESD
jgi:tetratricopeptide (TPR) repeat protein